MSSGGISLENDCSSGADRLVAVLVERARQDRGEQHEADDDTRVAGAQRPPPVHDLIRATAQSELGESSDRQAEAGTDEELWRERPSPARTRHERERGKPTGQQDHTDCHPLDLTDGARS